MWKIYGASGAGVAVTTNGARIETALVESAEQLQLGAVEYRDPAVIQIGMFNAFDTIMVKRASYEYEAEVRLVHWHTGSFHDALENFAWNEETMRFGDLIEDTRPIKPGMSFECGIDVLVEKVIISPFAPPWCAGMIERMRDRLGHRFPVHMSNLLEAPHVIP